jgi:uncharacterized protein YndB with AHSA1/START domain
MIVRSVEVSSAAPPPRVWAVLVDGLRWREWNDGIEWMTIEGPLVPGTIVTMKPRRAPQTALRIEAVEPERLLALILTIGPLATMRLRWELRGDSAGTAIAQSVAIEGPLAQPLLARAAQRIAGGMEPTLARLAARAAE